MRRALSAEVSAALKRGDHCRDLVAHLERGVEPPEPRCVPFSAQLAQAVGGAVVGLLGVAGQPGKTGETLLVQ